MSYVLSKIKETEVQALKSANPLFTPNEKKGDVYREFTLADAIQKIETSPKPKDGASYISGTGGFYENKSFEIAFDKLKRGDAQLYDKIQASALRSNDEDRCAKRAFEKVRDCSGAEVLIDEYLAHSPECMVEYFPVKKQSSKFVDLVLNCSVSAGNSAEKLHGALVKLFAEVKALEVSGKRCQISVGEGTLPSSWASGSNQRYQIKVVIKRYNEPLNPAVVAWCMCSPDFLRRILFRLEELESDEIRKCFGFMSGNGYGRPSHYISTTGKEVILDVKDII